MKTPDITLAQILSAIGAIATQAVALSVLDKGTAQLVTQIAGIIVPAVWTLADTIIRGNRAKVVIAQTTAPVANFGTVLTDKPAGSSITPA